MKSINFQFLLIILLSLVFSTITAQAPPPPGLPPVVVPAPIDNGIMVSMFLGILFAFYSISKQNILVIKKIKTVVIDYSKVVLKRFVQI